MNRRDQREQAFILIFERTNNNDTIAQIVENAGESRDLVLSAFAEKVATGVQDNEAVIDEKIEQMTQILEKSTLILKDPKYKIFVKNMTEEGVEVLVKVAVDNPLDDSYIISELMKEFKRKIEIEDKK